MSDYEKRYLDLFSVAGPSFTKRSTFLTNASMTIDTQATDSISKLVLEAETTQAQIILLLMGFLDFLLADLFLKGHHIAPELAANISFSISNVKDLTPMIDRG
jgi:hypothetical protein